MSFIQDILKGADDKYSLKNVHSIIAFLSGILLCFVIVLLKYHGKDISIEIPTLLLTTSLGLSGISGWQNIAHFKAANGVVDPAPAPDVNVDNSTIVNLDKVE